jgi:Transcriptional regulator, AbiEi antitoxin
LRDKGHIAAKIARLADRQFGHVTRRQLGDLGVPTRTITRWVEKERLIKVHAGVYAVGHQQHTPIALAMAAVLACGDQAILSHDSAAALWGVRTWPSLPEVTAPHDRRRRGVHSHRTTTLTRTDIRRHRNVRVTSPSRTILDIQDRLTDKQLTRAINDLRLKKHLKATELDRLVNHSIRIRNLIDPNENPTRSDLEDRFVAFCREYGLPHPTPNTTPYGRELDMLFPDEKVIVELDSWRFHQDRASFESDRERDRIAAEHGYLTVRLTWTRLTAEEAARLHRILELRRQQAA